MKPETRTVWRITSNRKRVGFVRLVETGDNAGKYVARIGNDTEIAADPRTAFDAVASRALGYDNVNDLRAHNRIVRAQRAHRRNEARALMNDYMAADSLPDRLAVIDRMFGFKR
jgi:hypothetical protein